MHSSSETQVGGGNANPGKTPVPAPTPTLLTPVADSCRTPVLATGQRVAATATRGTLGLAGLQNLGVGRGPWGLSQVGPVSAFALQRLRTGAEMCVRPFPRLLAPACQWEYPISYKYILGNTGVPPTHKRQMTRGIRNPFRKHAWRSQALGDGSIASILSQWDTRNAGATTGWFPLA